VQTKLLGQGAQEDNSFSLELSGVAPETTRPPPRSLARTGLRPVTQRPHPYLSREYQHYDHTKSNNNETAPTNVPWLPQFLTLDDDCGSLSTAADTQGWPWESFDEPSLLDGEYYNIDLESLLLRNISTSDNPLLGNTQGTEPLVHMDGFLYEETFHLDHSTRSSSTSSSAAHSSPLGCKVPTGSAFEETALYCAPMAPGLQVI
jgi:hypothetical protein